MAEEKMAPQWVFDQKNTSEFFDKEALSSNELKRISKMSSTISDDEIVEEKDRIEVCASNKTPYYYNGKWSDSVKSELKEYAVICGMDMNKFRSANPSSIVVAENENDNMVKTASKLEIKDAFKIDEKIANSYEKSKWVAEAKNASRLSEKPSMNGIIPIRGGEDYFANSNPKTARGQNSITEPDAIDKFANNEKEDVGARLKRENKEKEESKKTRHEEWQKDKIAAMDGKEIVPNRGRVYPTESLNAQPGIRGEVFDFDKVPERTEGEKIKEANEDYRKKIRGENKQKHEFTTEKSPSRSISDTFGEELKKFLNK